jgi:hypothetical protein
MVRVTIDQKLELSEQVNRMTGRQLRSALQVICGYDPELADLAISWARTRHPEPTAFTADEEDTPFDRLEQLSVTVLGKPYTMRREQ